MIRRIKYIIVFALAFTFLISGIIRVYNIEGYISDNDMQYEYVSGNGVFVLSYHRILSYSPVVSSLGKMSRNKQLTEYNVDNITFETQIEYLIEKGVEFITPEQLEDYIYNDSELPAAKCVLLTFDDIDETVYKNAFPILKKHEIPALTFIITGRVGENYQSIKLADWEQIQIMQDSNLINIGVHTHDMHRIVRAATPVFLIERNNELFLEDSEESLKAMETKINKIPRYFAYPYGYGNKILNSQLMDIGYKLIFTLRPTIATNETPPESVGRLLVTDESFEVVKEWVEEKE